MTIQQLEYFISIVENTSMNKAAEALHISQSSLSLSMNKLEEQLGVKLFKKEGRMLQLTEAGTMFYERGKSILQEIEQLEISVKHIENKSHAVSVVSGAVDFSLELLGVIQHFRPDVHVYHYRELNHNKARHCLDKGSAVFMFSQMKETGADYVSELLVEEPYLVALSKEEPLNKKKQISLSDLEARSFITLPMETTIRYLTEKIFQEARIYPKTIIEVNDPETTLTSVILGQGVAFVPKSVIESQKTRKSRFGKLVNGYSAKTISENFAKRAVYIIYRKDASMTEEEKLYLQLSKQTTEFIRTKGRYPTEGEYDEIKNRLPQQPISCFNWF